jgi:branched-chain amino acid transport system permease protein
MMGASFVIEAFVTVVAGGADVLVGTPPAAIALALIKATATAFWGQVYGVMGLLLAVCLVVRLLPEGFTGWMLRRRA